MDPLIDTHCHLDFESFDDDRDMVVNRATEAGVRCIIVPAIDLDGCQHVLALAERYNNVFAAIGVHPNSTADWQEDWIDELRKLAKHDKVVAIGEIGLDYYRDYTPRLIQQEACIAQVNLAVELNLPAIIHNRESDADVIHILAQSQLPGRRQSAVLHSFSSKWSTAKKALDLGLYLGFTGPLTYKKADDLRAVAAQVPLNQLLVETDAPFLAPQKHRGRRNEPSYVRLVAEKLAELHSISLNEISARTTDNAIKLFGDKLDDETT